MPRWQAFKSPLLACSLLLSPAGAIAEQAPPAPGGSVCYELIPAAANTLPGAPLLVNKCSGQTYVLTRMSSRAKATGHHVYRWHPIALGNATETKPRPAAAAPAGSKCFAFDGRQFCP